MRPLSAQSGIAGAACSSPKVGALLRGINLSVCFADSSPSRGALGRTVLALLDEKSFTKPETVGPCGKGQKEFGLWQ